MKGDPRVKKAFTLIVSTEVRLPPAIELVFSDEKQLTLILGSERPSLRSER